MLKADLSKCKNHYERRRVVKKLRRKSRRQKAARLVPPEAAKSVDEDVSSDSDGQEEQRLADHAAWLAREEAAQLEFAARKQAASESAQRQLQSVKKNREEFRVWKADLQQRQTEERRQETASLLAVENSVEEPEDPWCNPTPPVNVPQRKHEDCPFYAKTSCCRFGDACSRNHPTVSTPTDCLLMPGLFSLDEYLPSVTTVEESSVYSEFVNSKNDEQIKSAFVEFFAELEDQLTRYGRVRRLVVCQNKVSHLHGNVFCQFAHVSDAQRAQAVFNGRWYCQRRVVCHFVNISSWKSAICGLFLRDCCTKGDSCNFLHPYDNSVCRKSRRSRSFTKSKSRSRSRTRSSNRRISSKSKSRSRSIRRSGSRSRSRKKVQKSHSRKSGRRSSFRSRSRSLEMQESFQLSNGNSDKHKHLNALFDRCQQRGRSRSSVSGDDVGLSVKRGRWESTSSSSSNNSNS